MFFIVVLGLSALGVYLLETQSGIAVPGVPLMGEALYRDAIRTKTLPPLGIDPAFLKAAEDALFAQSKLETASWSAWYFPKTNNLWNRHVGSGRGFWVGAGKDHASLKEGTDFVYVSDGDPDIRIYADVYQCAEDMAELLQDGLYRQALAGLQRGSAPDYFNGLQAVGFSASGSYASELNSVYDKVTGAA